MASTKDPKGSWPPRRKGRYGECVSWLLVLTFCFVSNEKNAIMIAAKRCATRCWVGAVADFMIKSKMLDCESLLSLLPLLQNTSAVVPWQVLGRMSARCKAHAWKSPHEYEIISASKSNQHTQLCVNPSPNRCRYPSARCREWIWSCLPDLWIVDEVLTIDSRTLLQS